MKKGALELNWINKNKSLYYEYDKDGNPGKPIWVDKNDIRVAEPRILKLVKEYGDCSKLKDPLDNALIKGDNLLALRTLVELFKNRNEKDKVKLILIDPPYNTKSSFEKYDDNLEISEWLTMLADRLTLLRKILRDDGFIFVHINFENSFYIRCLLEQIFSKFNYVGNFIWSYDHSENTGVINKNHEEIIVYSKSKNPYFYLPKFILEQLGRYIEDACFRPPQPKNPSSDLFIPKGIKIERVKNKTFPNELNFGKSKIKVIKNKLEFKNGRLVNDVILNSNWTVKSIMESYFDKLINSKDKIIYDSKGQIVEEIYFSSTGRLYYKKKRSETSKIPSVLRDLGTYSSARVHLYKLFGKKEFDYPKPEEITKYFIELTTSYNDLVLDSFLGSGTTITTAHKLKRRWIGVEIGKHAKELGVKRLNLVINNKDSYGISNAVNWKGGGGFRYYELGDSLFKDNDLNWKLNKKGKLIAKAVFLNTDFKYQKQIQEGVFFGKRRKKYALCIIDKNLRVLNKRELRSIINKIPQDYDILEIFTNLGLALKTNELSDSIQIRKIPQAIRKRFSKVKK